MGAETLNKCMVSLPSIHLLKQYKDVAVVPTCDYGFFFVFFSLPSSKTPFKQSQVIILNKSQGQEYDTAYRKGEGLFPAYTTTCT